MMRTFRNLRAFNRVAIFTTLVLVISPLAAYAAGYTWPTVTPLNGSFQTTNPLLIGATVDFNGGTPLVTGWVSASASNYNGTVGYSYSYSFTNTEGVFGPLNPNPDPYITFTPPLPAGRQITVKYTAQTAGSGGMVQASTSTTCTSQ